FGDETAFSDQVVGNVAAIGWLIGGGSGDREKLAETLFTVFEMMAERAKPDGHHRFGECHGLRVLVSESTARKQSGITHHGAFELRVGRAIEYFEACCLAIDTTTLFWNGGRDGIDEFGNQKLAQVHHFKHA